MGLLWIMQFQSIIFLTAAGRAGSLMAMMAAGFLATAKAQTNALPGSSYNIYAGNTHSHTEYTWSHGEQWVTAKPEAGEAPEKLRVTPEGVQSPPLGKVLQPDWQKVQGPPSAHFALAKSN